MVAGISLAFRLGMMLVLFMSIFFSVNAYVDGVKKTVDYNKLQKIAEYVETKVENALEGIGQFEYNNTQYLNLPQLDVSYFVNLSCDDQLVIRVEANIIGKKYIIPELLNCNRIIAGGQVYAGHRCLVTKKLNNTSFNMSLVNECGFV